MNFISCRAVYVYLEFVHICKKNKIPVLSTRHWSKIWRGLSTILLRTLENMENIGEQWRNMETVAKYGDRDEIWRPWRNLETVAKFEDQRGLITTQAARLAARLAARRL